MGLLDRLQPAAQSFLARGINSYVAEHRAELVEALERCQVERGRAWLVALCEQYPIAAGFVTIAMRGTPAQAIVAIEMFDKELAQQLAQHIDALEQLQAAWNESSPSAPAG